MMVEEDVEKVVMDGEKEGVGRKSSSSLLSLSSKRNLAPRPAETVQRRDGALRLTPGTPSVTALSRLFRFPFC
jgi:hypothetical protein